MKKALFSLVILVLVFGLFGCISPNPAAENTSTPANPPEKISLKVYAPSSLTEAAKDLTAAFEAAHSGVTIEVEFGHSPTQRLQFKQGASGDVFITASQKDMDDAATDETVASDKIRIFATNQLVVILPAENQANIQTLEDLAKPGVRLLVAVADTPIGKVTLNMLDKWEKQFGAGYKEKVLTNVVSNESGVKPIVSKIKLGEADAGIVYVTDVASVSDVKSMPIPGELNMTTQLNVAPLAKADHPDQAAAFAEFLTSSEGQALLKKWGFQPGKP